RIILTQSVIHSHGPNTVALTLNGKNFVPVDFEGNLYFPEVPVITIPYDQYVELAPVAVANSLTNHKICVVRGHGVYAQGTSINLAYKWSCSLELSAKTYFIAQQADTILE
ncbi:MAG: class II aldolase/adducin family protein, partial [Chromatiales bacterium]|nr:class II aldolase/adducin family protein [Chromatiales bacterium]